ncbi:MAG: hypothetical protein U1E70_17260 [Acetobacteraceae bacterium]
MPTTPVAVTRSQARVLGQQARQQTYKAIDQDNRSSTVDRLVEWTKLTHSMTSATSVGGDDKIEETTISGVLVHIHQPVIISNR